MAAITAKMVNDMRAKTGVGMMDCKKALVETDGNFDEAIKVLREKGLGKADKKASRIAAEGVVDIMVKDDVAAGTKISLTLQVPTYQLGVDESGNDIYNVECSLQGLVLEVK